MTDERKALHHLYDEAARIEHMPRGIDRDVEIRTFMFYFQGYVKRIMEPIPAGAVVAQSEPESDLERDRR